MRPAETAEATGDCDITRFLQISSAQSDEWALYGLVHVLVDYGFVASGALVASVSCTWAVHVGFGCSNWPGSFHIFPCPAGGPFKGWQCLVCSETKSWASGRVCLSDSFWRASARIIILCCFQIQFVPICADLGLAKILKWNSKTSPQLLCHSCILHAWRLGDESWRRWGHLILPSRVDLFLRICQVLFGWFVCHD